MNNTLRPLHVRAHQDDHTDVSRLSLDVDVDVDFQPMAAGGAHFPPYYAGRSQIPGGS